MGADLSRVRFDAHRDHAGVVLQQGRLLLDADFNELVDVLDRRIRAGIADLDSPGPAAGIAGVAVVPRTTPQGFAITLAGGAMRIGRGRMYVDGLLAEQHGAGPAQFDPILAEQHGGDATPYDAQPYWPAPDPLPTTGTHLAYLDVWQREVTHVEAPDLVDPAIAVDTTARTQIAWQVRLHPLPASGAGCGTADAAIPGWEAVIAPSGARLSVGTIPVADTDDPCALPPAGGYRGLENQTYRVQVHTGGQLGTATFTWSRDNASVVEPVVEVLPGATAVRPASLGRDAVLGFADRDWVEILDDRRELSGLPGEMRRIEVDEAAGTITFSPALPADLVMTPAQAAARHLRVRRWDQRGRVTSGAGAQLTDLDAPGASGVITVPASAATSVVLEHGIVVRFSSTGGAFRVGDHWEFVARAADASVEELDAAPPRGVHHHYARLAVVTFPGTVTDCRTVWPPPAGTGERSGCSDCTVCVTPASHASGALTIQAAVHRVVEAGGGTVCLAAGAYHLDEGGVLVQGASSVRIRGQGLRTVLLASGEGIVVDRSTSVTVEDLTVVSTGTRPGVTLSGTVRARIEAVTVVSIGRRDVPEPAVLLRGVALFPSVIDCVLVAGTGIAAGETLLTGGLDVARNVLLCATAGIDLSGQVVHLLGNRVAGNTVLRCAEVGIRLLGSVAPGHGLTLADNVLLADGAGIEVSSTGCTVTGNEVTGTARSLESRGHGIAVRGPSAGSLRGPTTITGNQVQDVGGAAVVVAAPVTALVASGNLIERALSGIVLVQRARAQSATITGNVVRDVASRPSDDAGRAIGIQVVGAGHANVESNVVDGVGTARETIGEAVGIDVLACAQSRVAGNAVDRIGFAEAGGRDLGIGVRGLLLRSAVSGNTVRRQPVDVDEDAPSGFQGLLVGADADPREPQVVDVRGYAVGTGAAAFVVGPHAAYAVAFRPATVTVDTNIVSGSGELATALVGVAGEVVASANQLHARLQGGAAALHVRASAASVSTNRLRGGEPSGVLDVDPKRVAVLGNLATNGITLAGGALTSPWNQFNPTGF